MQLLTFRSQGVLFAVETRSVVEVVPRVPLRPIPHAPPPLAGLLDFRGRLVPVVDFNELTGTAPAPDALSTRLIVAEFTDPGGGVHRVALRAEQVSGVTTAAESDVVLGAPALAEAPFLGPVLRLAEGLVQLVRPDRLLPERLRAALSGTEPGS